MATSARSVTLSDTVLDPGSSVNSIPELLNWASVLLNWASVLLSWASVLLNCTSVSTASVTVMATSLAASEYHTISPCNANSFSIVIA